MRRLIRNNLFFLVPYLVFVAAAGALLLLYPKRDLHLLTNAHYSSFGDIFFEYMTYLGDGITAVVVCLLLLGLGLKPAATSGFSILLASGITQLLKHTIWFGEPRPKWFFENSLHEPLRLVPGYENYNYDSFPSGHTTTAFALCFSLALLVPRRHRWGKLALFALALLIGYSRIYLSQHFLRDVLFGSLIGVTVTLICFYFSARMNWLRLPHEKPLDT